MAMRPHFRRGFGLPMALLAMTVIGIIVTVAFYASTRESASDAELDMESQAFYLAEYGLDVALGTWKAAQLNGVRTVRHGDPVEVSSAGEVVGTYRLTARRVGGPIFLITSEGRVDSGAGDAVRRVGRVVRTLQAEVPVRSAVVANGALWVGDASRVRGDGAGPDCAAGATVPGVTATNASLIQGSGTISGAPSVARDDRLDPAFLSEFGGVRLEDLIASASRVYRPGARVKGIAPVVQVDESAGLEGCDTRVRSNWGDPTGGGACADEFPIIHARGDLHVSEGSGQGVLIVDGDLHVSGDFRFYGVVVVRGEMETRGTGNHLEGNVILQGGGSTELRSSLTGDSVVQYSDCRVRKAFDGVLRPRPLAKRSWVDFSAPARAITVVG